MSNSVAGVLGIWDAANGALLGLIKANGAQAYGDRIVIAALTAGQSGAGGLIAALNAAQTGLLKADGSPLAVGAVDSVAGLGPTARDIPGTDLIAILTPLQAAALDISWANLAVTSGTFVGQRKRLPSLDGVGYVWVYWDGTKWTPEGVQVLFDYDRATGTTGTTSGVTIPTTSIPGGPFWKKTKLDIGLALTSTVNGCNPAPVLMAFGAMNLINDTTQPSRAKSFNRVINIQDDAVQFCFTKLDNQYSGYANLSSGPLSGTVSMLSAVSLTAGTSTGWVNGSSHTLSLEQYRCLWYR